MRSATTLLRRARSCGVALGSHGRTQALPHAVPLARGLASQGAASSSDLADQVKLVTEKLQEEVLSPLNQRLLGPLERRPFAEGVPLPLVLLLGNHSSGKSSFINYVLGRDVQATGVAPTDDGFTVIAPGSEDADRDGASFIGDPGLGFSPLRAFGPAFMNHFRLKVRTDLATSSLLLVDSPGMIDSPAALGVGGSVARNDSTSDRGYDFLRVTRWLAEHADVILLFFDPDKPGTTGETLECLTTSLSGTEHKVRACSVRAWARGACARPRRAALPHTGARVAVALTPCGARVVCVRAPRSRRAQLHIVMNKVDQFVHIHDFARAYGSLCWNLSKVIPRKDLPRIYTMFLPPEARGDRGQPPPTPPAPSAVPSAMPSAAAPLSKALEELNATRDEVLHAVRAAPERRVDNLLTRCYDACALLRMHALTLEEARLAYTSLRARYLALCSGLVASAPLAGYVAFAHADVTAQLSTAASGGLLALAALVAAHGRGALGAAHAQLTSEAGLDAAFERLYVLEVSEGDEYVRALWRRARPQLQHAVGSLNLAQLERISPKEIARLDEVLQQTIPELRRRTSSRGAAAEPPPSPPDAAAAGGASSSPGGPAA